MLFCIPFVKPPPGVGVDKEEYIKYYPNLPEKDKKCVREERFEIGMLNETVFFLAGEPKKIDTIEQDNNEIVKWLYRHKILKKEYGIKGFIFNTEGNLIKIIKYK